MLNKMLKKYITVCYRCRRNAFNSRAMSNFNTSAEVGGKYIDQHSSSFYIQTIILHLIRIIIYNNNNHI